MIDLIFPRHHGLEGLDPILTPDPPFLGGLPPILGVERGGLPPILGVKGAEIRLLCPQGPPGRSSMAAFLSYAGSIEAHLGGVFSRRPSKTPPFGSIFPCGCGGKI